MKSGLPVAVLAEPIHLDDNGSHHGDDQDLQQNEEEDGHGHPLLVRFANLRGRNVDSISSYLFDMVREDHTCTSVLGGWSRTGCNRVVEWVESLSRGLWKRGGRGYRHTRIRGNCEENKGTTQHETLGE